MIKILLGFAVGWFTIMIIVLSIVLCSEGNDEHKIRRFKLAVKLGFIITVLWFTLVFGYFRFFLN